MSRTTDDLASLNRPLVRSAEPLGSTQSSMTDSHASQVRQRRPSRMRASTAPVASTIPMSRQPRKKFKPSSVWAAPALGTRAHKKAKKAQVEKTDAPLPPLSDHWTRYFLVEIMGNFVATTLYSGCILGIYINMNAVAYENIPVVSSSAPFQQTFSFPTPTLYVAIMVGMSYSLGILTAPEAQLNPVFSISMSLFGLRRWGTVLPSIAGQLLGVMLSNVLIYAMAKDLHFWDPNDLSTASIFGVTYPRPVSTGLKQFPIALNPHVPQLDMLRNGTTYRPAFPLDENNTMFFVMGQVSNSSAFLSTTVFTAILVLVIIPLFTAQKLSHAASAFGIGLVVATFVASGSALGVCTNPGLWFGGAISCIWLAGFSATGSKGIFSWSQSYWWIGLVAPFMGAVMGGLLLELYGYGIFFPPHMWCRRCRRKAGAQDSVQADASASASSQRSKSVLQQQASKNPHERAAANYISSDSGEEDSGTDEFAPY